MQPVGSVGWRRFLNSSFFSNITFLWTKFRIRIFRIVRLIWWTNKIALEIGIAFLINLTKFSTSRICEGKAFSKQQLFQYYVLHFCEKNSGFGVSELFAWSDEQVKMVLGIGITFLINLTKFSTSEIRGRKAFSKQQLSQY